MTLKRVLHVDDDEDIRTIVSIALTVVGNFELKQCPDGRSAIEVAADFQPDLLLLDVMMPEMSGQQLRTEIAGLPGFEDVATIFVTAKAEDDFTSQLCSEGALGVITKPFDPMTLADEIRDIWARTRGTQDTLPDQAASR